MNRQDIIGWAEGILESDSRVDWQRVIIDGDDIARMVRAEQPEATDADLDEIAELINEKLMKNY